MNANNFALVLLLNASFLITNALPNLPSASTAHSANLNYYPPAEPNYPPLNPFPRSAPLPPSDKTTALLDAFSQRLSAKTDPNSLRLPGLMDMTIKRWSSIEQEAPIVHMSSAMHPDNYYPQNKRILPNRPMPRDAFVISNDPMKASVQKSIRGSLPQSEFALGPITNPAAYFLQGAHLDNVQKPKCEMFDCEGPLPNDGSIRFTPAQKPSQSCYQTFVPLNTCVDEKGYPVGMVCTICCDCTNSLIIEMKNSRGYKIGFNRK